MSDKQEQTITLPVSTNLMKMFADQAQNQALLLALKVDEQAMIIEELQRQLASVVTTASNPSKENTNDGSK